jgi:hypothetical protein
MVQLTSAKCGHLVFLSDVAWVTILTNPSMSELARGSFEHVLPRLRVEDGAIMIQCRDFSSLNLMDHSQKKLGAITLNPSIPWEIEFRGRTSNLTADLRGLELRSLDLLGGVSRVSVLVPKPAGTSFIYVTGGIDNSVIHAPTDVGINVRVNGLVNHLFLDDRHFDAPGGKTSLENADFKSADSWYDICVTGGVHHVTIEH